MRNYTCGLRRLYIAVRQCSKKVRIIVGLTSVALPLALTIPLALTTSVAKANSATAISVKTNANKQQFIAQRSDNAVIIDGIDDDPVWQNSNWYPINVPIINELPSKQDFSGEFALSWDQDYLYLLAKFQDDVLYDQHADPLYKYWDDDCLEVFIDEDKSGGNHQFNYNAFAYHVALDNQSVDIGESTEEGEANFVLLNDHVNSQWRRSSAQGNYIVWELAIKVFNDKFKLDTRSHDSREKLFSGKELGFMLAYCDNDGSATRESFIGSTNIEAKNGDRNLGYITADVFSSLRLVDAKAK
mgnify:CR=1 FL=1